MSFSKIMKNIVNVNDMIRKDLLTLKEINQIIGALSCCAITATKRANKIAIVSQCGAGKPSEEKKG